MKPISIDRTVKERVLGWLTRLIEIALGLKPGSIAAAQMEAAVRERKRENERRKRALAKETLGPASALIGYIQALLCFAHGRKPAIPEELTGRTELLERIPDMRDHQTIPQESGEESKFVETYVKPRIVKMRKELDNEIRQASGEDKIRLTKDLTVVTRALNLLRPPPKVKPKPPPPASAAKAKCPIPEDPAERRSRSRRLKHRLGQRARDADLNPKQLPPSPTEPQPELVSWIVERDPTLAVKLAATAVRLDPMASTDDAREYAFGALVDLPFEPSPQYQQLLQQHMRWPKIPVRQIGKPKGDGATEPPPENITVTTE